jgi:hypothetical protein
MTAEDVVAIYTREQLAHAKASLEVRNYAVRLALAARGYTPLDAFRARYWIRQGKPADYFWDQYGARSCGRGNHDRNETHRCAVARHGPAGAHRPRHVPRGSPLLYLVRRALDRRALDRRALDRRGCMAADPPAESRDELNGKRVSRSAR